MSPRDTAAWAARHGPQAASQEIEIKATIAARIAARSGQPFIVKGELDPPRAVAAGLRNRQAVIDHPGG